MKVTIDYSEELHFTASARHFNDLHIDEPEAFHGTGLGPSSIEYVLIGVGGCLGSTFVYCLQKQNVEIDDLKIVIDGKLKHSGPNKRLRLVSIDAELIFSPKNNESDEKVLLCVEKFQEHCVVSNSIIQGTPINVNVSKK